MRTENEPLRDLETSTILMVDDEPTTLEVLETFLEAEGFTNLVTTSDPRSVLPLLERHRPDVLILNLLMPGLGGLEILRAVRGDPALAGLPVIILTSSSDPGAKQRALELGASDFLAKPVDPSELTLRVRNVLTASRLEVGARPQDSGRGGARPSPATCSGPPVTSWLAAKNPRVVPIARKFVARLEEKLCEMEAAFETRSYAAIESLAHWLKGAGGTVGFDAFTEPAEMLKLQARQHKETEIEASISELRDLACRIVLPPKPRDGGCA